MYGFRGLFSLRHRRFVRFALPLVNDFGGGVFLSVESEERVGIILQRKIADIHGDPDGQIAQSELCGIVGFLIYEHFAAIEESHARAGFERDAPVVACRGDGQVAVVNNGQLVGYAVVLLILGVSDGHRVLGLVQRPGHLTVVPNGVSLADEHRLIVLDEHIAGIIVKPESLAVEMKPYAAGVQHIGTGAVHDGAGRQLRLLGRTRKGIDQQQAERKHQHA